MRPEPVTAADPVLSEIRDLLTGYVPRGYITAAQAAHYLGIPQETLRQWIRTRHLPVYKPGKLLLFKTSELDQWMARHKLRRVKI